MKSHGSFANMHEKVLGLIQQNQITESDTPELIIINEEPYSFVDYFWRNILTDNTQWLVIKLKTKDEAINCYKELRGFGETFLSIKNKIVIIKNLKQILKSHYRSEILSPVIEEN